MPLVVVAIGGNSLTKSKQVGSIPEQIDNASETCRHLVPLVQQGWQLVLTHGNGPQVGNVLLRVELAADRVYRLPLDVCVADTQGGMGYMLQQVLANELAAAGTPRPVVSLVTRMLVDAQDPDFASPSKPIGPFFDEAYARQMMRERGWRMKEDAGRGWRRLVPSPKPLRILEEDAVRAVLAAGVIPIAVGGGGVPVVAREGGRLAGVEAVVDKDRASALLARDLEADLFVISTGVDRVQLDYGKPTARAVEHLSVTEAARYLAEGQFPAGSMGPKIEAALSYLRGGGKQVVITSPEHIEAAVRGEAGTRIG